MVNKEDLSHLRDEILNGEWKANHHDLHGTTVIQNIRRVKQKNVKPFDVMPHLNTEDDMGGFEDNLRTGY